MSYLFLDDLTTADVAFIATGRNLPELFRSAADAVLNAMLDDINRVAPVQRREVRLRASAPDRLLFDFMQEFLFYKDAEELLLRTESVEISGGGDQWKLWAQLTGETIDPERHDMIVDVKAVTFHEYYLRETKEGWEAQVILDV